MSNLNFSNITEQNIQDTLDEYIEAYNKFYSEIILINNEDLSWNSYIQKKLDFHAEWKDKLIIFNMSRLHPDETIRKKCHECDTKLSEFKIEEFMKRNFFEQFKYYYNNQYQTEKNDLSFERIRYIEKFMESYRIYGLELPDDKYEKVKELMKKLSNHSINFKKNLSNYNKEFILTSEQLSGLSSSWLKMREQVTEETEDSNTTVLYKVNLKYPDYYPIMQKCTNRETRKLMHQEFNKRCFTENEEIINSIFKLRNELAKQFGFNLYSDYKLQNKMAKNSTNVIKFLDDLKNKIKPVLNSDYEKILSLSKIDGINTLEELKIYDMTYYCRILREKKSDLDMEELKKYFPLEQIIKGTFDIYETLFEYKFVDITDKYKDTFWHSDVKLFQVLNKSDNTIQGEFYLDLHPRNGKYGHAAVFPIKRGSIKQSPICIMVCNFPSSENLSFGDVVTFFHEFGHVMHSISSRPEISTLSGTTVVRDAVECPSQMLEEWCFREKSLRILAPDLPIDIITKITKQEEKVIQGFDNAKQLVLCYVDMALHGDSYDTKDPNQLYSTIFKDLIGLDVPSGHGFLQTFGHLMGYDSGYYGYLYSESFAKCLFEEKFKDHELDPNVGIEYKNKIMAPGNTRDFMDLMIDFLGHEPTNDAFIKSLI
jgi:Zn-dependent oligopeptidase